MRVLVAVLLIAGLAGCASEADVAKPSLPAPPILNDAIWMVFFDSDKANLSAEAHAVLAEAAFVKQERVFAASRVLVDGHTDMAEEHARELSLRRAQAVRAALIRLGVPEGQIIVRAHGTDDPMVQTASGVKEPQNRRVVVAFPDLDATQIQR